MWKIRGFRLLIFGAMQALYSTSETAIDAIHTNQRLVLQQVNRNAQLNIILGLRGVGKTTYLLQEAKKRQKENKSTLYLALDDLYFLDNNPMTVIEQFHAEGGEYLFIDEVHYYEYWGRLLKLTFDRYPRLKVWATGSSALKLYEGKADLSRRAQYFIMPGLSFRAYAQRHYNRPIFEKTYSLKEILENGKEIANPIGKHSGIRKVFHDYLEEGYFPFGFDSSVNVRKQVAQTIKGIFEIDMQLIDGFDLRDSRKTLAFLKHVAASVPYEINIAALAKKIGLPRNKLIQYIYALEQADLAILVNDQASKKGSYSKPDKIYLNNPNMYHALNPQLHNPGAVRESFALNQLLSQEHEINLHKTADFLIDDKYAIEIGGKSKNVKQIAGLEHGYIFADNLEVAYGKRLPLWMLGFLY